MSNLNRPQKEDAAQACLHDYELAQIDKDPAVFPQACIRLAQFQPERKVILLQQALYYMDLLESEDEQTDNMIDAAEDMLMDMPLAERMIPVGGTDFRLMNEKEIYLHCPAYLAAHGKELPSNSGDTGILAYGYIDEDDGLCFRFLCSAVLEEDELQKGKSKKSDRIVLHYKDVETASFVDLGYVDIDASEFDNILKRVSVDDETKNQDKEDMRGFAFLDAFRSEECPDDVRSVLTCPAKRAETGPQRPYGCSAKRSETAAWRESFWTNPGRTLRFTRGTR